MRKISVAAFLAISACSPSGSDGNPRDRIGDANAAAKWGVVQQGDGLAAFLARPGTAPDLVFWCRDGTEMVARAHVFKAPSQTPDLSLTTATGGILFEKVRRQGGVREGDRTLVEGFTTLQDPKINTVLSGANSVTLRSGAETYIANNADVDGVMTGFAAQCQALTDPRSKVFPK